MGNEPIQPQPPQQLQQLQQRQQPEPPPQPKPIKKIINGYEIKQKIGQGSFGVVFQAQKNNRVYAIKIVQPVNQIQQLQMINQAQLMMNFKSEYLVKLFENFKWQNKICLVMEKCDMDLFTRLTENNISLNQRTKYCCQIIRGVSYLHTNKIAHKDLKPQNILIKNGRIKISDFGSARKIERSDYGRICGTHHYMAPQIFKGQKHTLAVDSYSLGIILLIILSGKKLSYFTKNGYIGCIPDFPKQEELNLIRDPFFRQIVRSCLIQNRKDRKLVTDIASQLEIKEMLERKQIIDTPQGLNQQELERFNFDDLMNQQIRGYIDLSN